MTCASVLGAPSSSWVTVSLVKPAVVLLDLVGDARRPLRRDLVVPEGAPRLDELPRRVGLDDLSVDDHLGHAHRLHLRGGERPVPAARPQVVLGDAAVAVLLRPLGLVIASQIASGVALMYTR